MDRSQRVGSRRAWAAAAITTVLAGLTALALTPQSTTASAAVLPASAGQLTAPASVAPDPAGSGDQTVRFGDGPTGTKFVHPGILLDQTQLAFVKDQIAAGNQPWTGALALAQSYKLSGKLLTSLSHTPTPFASLDRATASATDIGLDDVAAYSDALIYAYTGNAAYADKAIAIMNAWSSTMTKPVNSTAQLDAAWAAEVFPRAAEIIRYTYTPADGHPTFDVAAFSAMLTNVLLPQLDPTSIGATQSNGNWELSMADGTMNIGVFTDNHAVFDAGVAMWRARVPSYIYETGDGAAPVPPPGGRYDDPAKLKCFWLNSGSPTDKCTVPAGFQYVQGMSQETCRDTTHTVLGYEAMVFGAETARLQGVDLYREQQKRIVDGYEFAAKYDLQAQSRLAPPDPVTGAVIGAVDDNICGGKLTIGGTGYTLGFEAVYNEYANRLGVPMPYSRQMISAIRPTAANLHVDFETLTSAGADLPSGCRAPDRRLGTDAVTVSVPSTGTYRIWSRINPAQADDVAYDLQVDGGCPISVGRGDAAPGQWSWVGSRDGTSATPVEVSLTAGAHTLVLSGRSPGLSISLVLPVANPDCVPVGDGTNCADLVPPTAPTSLQSTLVTPTSVTLAWSGATDDTAIDHYEIYRDGVRIGTSTDESYTDQSAVPQTDYQYTVRTMDGSVNRSGDSVAVVVRTANTPVRTSVTAPSADRPVHGRTTISARTSDDARVSSIDFALDGDVIGTAVSAPFAISWDSESVADGPHTVEARTSYDAGALSTSDPVTFTVSNQDATPPAAPTGLSAQAQPPGSVVLSWDPAPDGDGVTGYLVARDGVQIGTTATNAFTDTTAQPARPYSYTVAAVDAAGNVSDPSDAPSATVPDTQAPTAPSGLTVRATSPTSITLNWGAASDDVGVTRYEVRRDGTTLASTGTTLSYTDSSVSPSSSYSYAVYAYDAAGNVSGPSTAATATTPSPTDTTPPTAPTGVSAVASASTSVTLGWQAATDDVGVTSYSVARNGVTVATGLTTRTYIDTGLTSATSYTYVVYARDAAGNVSPGSLSIGVATLDVTAPTLGTVNASAGSASQVNLTWAAATDNVGVTGYRLSRNGTVVTTTSATTRAYSDTGLAAGTSYAYSLVALDAAGNTSPAAAVKTSTLPTTAPVGAGFAGQYFAGKTLSGPAITRLDPTVNFKWGTAAPMTGIPADGFSVRWTGQLTPTASATYTLYLQSDDGARLWVNNTLLIDNWAGPAATRSATYAFSAGKAYQIRMEYVEQTGTATAALLWSRPGVAQAAVPASVMSSASTGLTGTYYATNDLSGAPAFTRPDATVNFAWATAAPDSRVAADNFSARWTGKVQAVAAGTYTFSTDSDDGVRLWVNNQLLIDNWTPHALATNSATISLAAGAQYSIRMEYREITGSATAKLYWAYPGAAKAIVPTTALRDR